MWPFLDLMRPAVNRMFNHIIGLDPFAVEKLRAMQGKVVHLVCLEQTFTLLIDDGGLVWTGEPLDADATVTGTPAAYAAAWFSDRTPADLSIAGSVSVAHGLFAVFKQLDRDWEERLSLYLGDVAARQICLLFAAAARQWRYHRDTAAFHLQEWMREGVQGTPYEFELDDFSREVSQLRTDSDRLAARVRRLQQRLRELTA